MTCRSSQGSPCLGSKSRQVKSNLDLVLVTEGLTWVEKLTQQHVQLKGIGFHQNIDDIGLLGVKGEESDHTLS